MDPPKDTCDFIAHRNNRECPKSPLPGSSFCGRHANTLQAQAHSESYSQKGGGTRKKEKETHYKKVQIVQGPNGLFVDKETGIVFNGTSHKAEGYQTAGGGVYPLTPHHVALCKKYCWDYNKDRVAKVDRDRNEEEQRRKQSREQSRNDRRRQLELWRKKIEEEKRLLAEATAQEDEED